MRDHVSPCRGCTVTRREFVSQATLAAVAATLAACGGGGGSGGTGPTVVQKPPTISTPLIITLGNFPVLASVGGVARVSSQPPIAMARTAAGLVAFSLECTHQGTVVDFNGPVAFKCPNHGAEFAFDGSWTGGQQSTSSLFRLTVTPDSTGTTAAISS